MWLHMHYLNFHAYGKLELASAVDRTVYVLIAHMCIDEYTFHFERGTS